jgi:hypothetical protein
MRGEGIVTVATGAVAVTPDVTVIRLGTEVVAPTLGQAMTANAEAAAAVLAALRSAGIADTDLRTEHIGVNPWHGPPYGNGPGTGPQAFAANTNLAIHVRPGRSATAVLEAAAAAGGEAFRLFGVSFTLSDPVSARAAARKAAVEAALAQARELAAAAGVVLGPLLRLEEEPGAHAAPLGGGLRMFAAAESAVSPVEAGSEQVTVTVRARFAVGNPNSG